MVAANVLTSNTMTGNTMTGNMMIDIMVNINNKSVVLNPK